MWVGAKGVGVGESFAQFPMNPPHEGMFEVEIIIIIKGILAFSGLQVFPLCVCAGCADGQLFSISAEDRTS